MLHKKQLEKQITDEVINDLFNIFINSNNKSDFILKIKKEKYQNPEKLWAIFFPKYDEHRLKNLEQSKQK